MTRRRSASRASLFDDKAVRLAAALWAANLIYVDARGNYRWHRTVENLSEGNPWRRDVVDAVRGKVIPQNKAVKRFLADANAAGKRSIIHARGGLDHASPYTLHTLADELGLR